MGLSVGLVGLPNVGKSTTFNALINAQNAQAQNYPFCTIEPNIASVPFIDERLEKIAHIVKPQKIIHSLVEFVDIAGLIEGASKGEGLGNKFLGNIRECEIILHMVRCFEDENIPHTHSSIDPLRDIDIIETELILADIQSLEKKIQKLQKDIKSKKTLQIAQDLLAHLEEGKKAKDFEQQNTDELLSLSRELRFLSAKDTIYGLNISEDNIKNSLKLIDEVQQSTKGKAVLICSKLEADMIGLENAEKEEFVKSLESYLGLNVIIKECFSRLGLINYFTAGPTEARSWSIKNGYKAPKAASAIHNDFERGFIKAQVISYEDFIKHKGEQGAREAGALRLEGKDYIVQDGDIMHFKFNV